MNYDCNTCNRGRPCSEHPERHERRMKVKAFFERNEDMSMCAVDDELIERFVELLLKREQEVHPRDRAPGHDEFRKTMNYYFRNSAAELKEEALNMFWVVLKNWANS